MVLQHEGSKEENTEFFDRREGKSKEESSI